MIIRVHIIYNSFDRVYPLFSVHSIYPTYLSYMSILSWSAPGLPSPPLVPAFGRGPGIAHVALPRPAADLVGTGRTDATQQLQNRVVARLVSLAFFGWGIKRGSYGKNGVFLMFFPFLMKQKRWFHRLKHGWNLKNLCVHHGLRYGLTYRKAWLNPMNMVPSPKIWVVWSSLDVGSWCCVEFFFHSRLWCLTKTIVDQYDLTMFYPSNIMGIWPQSLG